MHFLTIRNSFDYETLEEGTNLSWQTGLFFNVQSILFTSDMDKYFIVKKKDRLKKEKLFLPGELQTIPYNGTCPHSCEMIVFANE